MERRLQWAIIIALIMMTGVGVVYAANLTMGNGEWIGLGASAGRIEFSDQTPNDQLIVRNADLIFRNEDLTAWEPGGVTLGSGSTLTDTILLTLYDQRYVFWDYFGTAAIVFDNDSIIESASVGARVYNSTSLSIPNNTWTDLTFNSERYDSGGTHSTSGTRSQLEAPTRELGAGGGGAQEEIHSVTANAERLTAPSYGLYTVSCSVAFDGNSSGYRMVAISHSVDGHIANEKIVPVDSNSLFVTVSTVYYANTGDYFKCRVYQNSGGSLNVFRGGAYSPEFSMARVP